MGAVVEDDPDELEMKMLEQVNSSDSVCGWPQSIVSDVPRYQRTRKGSRVGFEKTCRGRDLREGLGGDSSSLNRHRGPETQHHIPQRQTPVKKRSQKEKEG